MAPGYRRAPDRVRAADAGAGLALRRRERRTGLISADTLAVAVPVVQPVANGRPAVALGGGRPHLTSMPPSPAYRPEPRFFDLGEDYGDAVQAATFPETRLRFRNDRAAATVGLETLTDAEWIAHFGRFEPLPGQPGPVAMGYHGHQFRTYNADLGDGRGFLAAQLRADDGRLLGAANRNAFDGREAFAGATTVSPQQLGPEAKLSRWSQLWTPVELEVRP